MSRYMRVPHIRNPKVLGASTVRAPRYLDISSTKMSCQDCVWSKSALRKCQEGIRIQGSELILCYDSWAATVHIAVVNGERVD